jgi:hypothetical protein
MLRRDKWPNNQKFTNDDDSKLNKFSINIIDIATSNDIPFVCCIVTKDENCSRKRHWQQNALGGSNAQTSLPDPDVRLKTSGSF